MRYLAIGIYVAAVIGLCAALPIRSAALGERNAFIFGALIFLSFGAVLAGCVCCKRRKKGFEEFKNESGTLESNKTEYPIFRALSPESQRSIPAANVNASAVNNSNENLIVDDIDNNNGPISPADLENIENNNAVDYIQNQNEIGLVIEPSPYSINRNLIDSQQVELEQHSDEELLQDVAISSTTDSYARSSSSVTSTTAISQNSLTSCSSNAVTCLANIEIYPFDNNKLDEDDDDDDDDIDDDIIVKEQIIVQENVPIVNADCTTNRQIELLRHHDESNDSRTTVIDIECMPNDNIRNILITPEKEYTTLPEETTSIKSISSDKSHEGNSVEEALRALDNAIEAEELNDIDDDEDDLPDEDFGEDATNFQNVIRQLLINNGINGILPNITTIVPDQVNENSLTIVNDDKVDNKNLENIRAEAAILVDSILNESQQIAEEKREHLKHNIETTFQIYSVPECSFEHNNKTDINLLEFSATDITSNLDTKPKTDINSPFLEEEADSFKSTDDLFSGEMLAQTSTPCIHNKFSTAPHSNQQNKISHNLFGGVIDDDLDTSSRILQNDVVSPTTTDNVTFTSPPFVNQTFDADKTYDINERDENQTEFTYPGDPCTSKQALERDYGYPIIKCERDDGNSEDLTTITPVNTPIELNYPHDTWDKMTKATNEGHMNDDQGDPTLKSGWFLHPQTNAELNNETFDAEDETNLELTFEALRKQLAEVLPQHQGMTGPPEYSDEEDDQQSNRTFDEYRSPLDGLVGLLESDSSAPVVASNEVFINYKRSLSPIIEESEEETCKTFILNETKCLDSTRNRRIISENKRRRNRELFTSRTGCVDTGEAIMGVTKTLMASNDTLFNFEDTLGDKEDVFSPRIPSRNESQATTPIKNYKSIEDNSLGTSESDTERGCGGRNPTPTDLDINQQGRKSPPKTIDFVSCSELKADSDLCSPDQQKTFSEGTSTSTTTDRLSSDISPTLDHDTTFTTNTIDEKTCITVIIKDDERISEISEPDWGSTASCGPYDVNSLTDIPSLDFNVNTFDKHFEKESIIKPDIELEEKTSLEDDDVENVDDDIDDNDEEVENIVSSTDNIHNNDIERDSGHDDSGHSTQASTDEKSTSNNMSAQEAQSLVENENLTNLSTPSNINTNLEIKQNCTQFLINEIEISSSQSLKDKKIPQHLQQQQQQQYNQLIRIDSADVEGSKENTDPNVKLYSNSFENDKISYQKVQMNSQDAVILEKSKNTTSPDFMEKDLTNGVHDNNMFHQSDITILPSKHQHTITSYSVNDVDGIHNEQNCLMVADEIIGHLSGEEDPWVESVNDIRYSGPCTEMISTSFNINEWDSDVDDSHSSEEFMYVRGTPTRDELLKITRSDEITDSDRQFSNTTDGTYDSNIWSSHEDKVPPTGVRHLAEEEVSEESSSEFEGEFIPSCWDSMAMPARSALKSPDKSSSENKKRRSVAFKNQRYHSVYEYPRENTSLSPAYSEPFLWNKLSESSLLDEKDQMEEFSDGFTVSSTMRPFHGSQFNVLCHTWPTDSDFSWSQVEDLSNIVEDKPLATYSNIEIKWPQNFTNVTNNEETATENIKIDENKRPDSGVGASAEMLSDRTSLGELRHTKATLRLPLEHIPPVEPPPPEPKPEIKENDLVYPESLILPTPSCTGSMDSLSSSSSSERQVSFTTFGKRNSFNENDKRINFDFNNQLRPALILIDGEPLDSNCLKPEKIKQSDSTDEDSGIESIMKVNKESD